MTKSDRPLFESASYRHRTRSETFAEYETIQRRQDIREMVVIAAVCTSIVIVWLVVIGLQSLAS
jgi:hypothetical protein